MPRTLGSIGTVAVDPELAKAATLPAAWYSDATHHERERRAVFGREWLVVGRATTLHAPGDYVATEIAGWPLLVVVGSDGRLRGFHNVCRHRAGPLLERTAEDVSGHCGVFVCGYHGWAYDLEGRLRRARDFGEAADFDPDDFALLAVRAERWAGLLWVNLDLDAAPLLEALAGLPGACASFDLERLSFSHELTVDLECNWKTYADNYMEGYHIPFVHPELNREVDARRYRVDVEDGYCRHSVPTRDGAVNSGTWLWRFPNLALNLYAEGMNVERFLPLGPRRTRVAYSYFFADLSPASQAARDDVVAMSTVTLDQDRRICEAVQRNLDAGAYDVGRLSPRHENGVFHFQSRVRSALAPSA